MPDGAIHYKFYLLKLTTFFLAVDNFVSRIIIVLSILMFGHQPLAVYLCVSECICVCDIARRMMKVDYETFTSTILPTMYQILVVVNVYQMRFIPQIHL